MRLAWTIYSTSTYPSSILSTGLGLSIDGKAHCAFSLRIRPSQQWKSTKEPMQVFAPRSFFPVCIEWIREVRGTKQEQTLQTGRGSSGLAAQNWPQCLLRALDCIRKDELDASGGCPQLASQLANVRESRYSAGHIAPSTMNSRSVRNAWEIEEH